MRKLLESLACLLVADATFARALHSIASRTRDFYIGRIVSLIVDRELTGAFGGVVNAKKICGTKLLPVHERRGTRRFYGHGWWDVWGLE